MDSTVVDKYSFSFKKNRHAQQIYNWNKSLKQIIKHLYALFCYVCYVKHECNVLKTLIYHKSSNLDVYYIMNYVYNYLHMKNLYVIYINLKC